MRAAVLDAGFDVRVSTVADARISGPGDVTASRVAAGAVMHLSRPEDRYAKELRLRG
jgi:hypothetical protein